jgi:hypothetical protein
MLIHYRGALLTSGVSTDALTDVCGYTCYQASIYMFAILHPLPPPRGWDEKTPSPST